MPFSNDMELAKHQLRTHCFNQFTKKMHRVSQTIRFCKVRDGIEDNKLNRLERIFREDASVGNLSLCIYQSTP